VSNNAKMANSSLSSEGSDWIENPFAKWLLTDGWTITDAADLVSQLAARLTNSGIVLRRLRIVIRTLHPLVFGSVLSWSRDAGAVEEYSPTHDVLETAGYRDSPIAAVIDAAKIIRRRLDVANPQLDFPYLSDLVAEGSTDYVAMPIMAPDGKVNVMTLVSDKPGGFDDSEVARIHCMLPALARVLETHTLRHFSKTLLETYLGKVTGKRVLDGLIKRGDGEKIHAVIWFSDLRDSTRMAERLPTADFLANLNGFFDCMAGAALDRGGEILGFVGDAVLAIFPIDCDSGLLQDACAPLEEACANALEAARDARKRIKDFNEQRGAAGKSPLGFGLALHVGDLTYGNIGVPERLQFTVVGAAVNLAVRLQSLCKDLDQSILVSSVFSRYTPDDWISLGHHAIRGVIPSQEVFTLSNR